MSRLASSAACLALMAGSAAAFELTILHTNDVHDRFEPISQFDGPCDPEDNAAGECFGGAARLVTAVDAARDRAGENVLLLDAGDWFQGTLFYQYYKEELIAEVTNALGYDAMAVGNHEFDDGPEVLLEFARAAEYPLLMANADLSGLPQLQGEIAKSTVLDVGGERIGVIGLTPQNNDELASPGPDIVFTDPAEAAQAEVDALTEDGVTKIVLLSHSGLSVDRGIAESVSGIDLILGGHSHTLMGDMEDAEGPYPMEVNGVPIAQAYAYGKYLGELRITFDDAGEVTAIEGAPVLLDAAVAEDPDMKARIEEAAAPLEEIRSRVVAEAETEIVGVREDCRARECAMGSLIADAMLERVADQGIDVALQNGGGIRASIDAGEITMGEVMTVLPFQNTLSTFEVTGATLLAALENGVSEIEEGAGRFPQVAGMTFTVDPSAEAGSRISDVTIGGEPLDEDATYGVVSNNYIRNGGDGYGMFVDAANAYDFGPDLAEVTAEYMGENSPIAPSTDGRITVAGE